MSLEELLKIFGAVLIGAALTRIFKGSDSIVELKTRNAVTDEKLDKAEKAITDIERDIKALWREHDQSK